MGKGIKKDNFIVLYNRLPEYETEGEDGRVFVHRKMKTFPELGDARGFAMRYLPSTLGKEVPVTEDIALSKEIPLADGDVEKALKPETPFLVIAHLFKDACFYHRNTVSGGVDGGTGGIRGSDNRIIDPVSWDQGNQTAFESVYATHDKLSQIVERYGALHHTKGVYVCLGLDIFKDLEKST